MVLRKERGGTMEDLITIALFFGATVALIVGVALGSLALLWICFGTIELPNIPRNLRIRKRLSELNASGFVPTLQHIYGGAGVAVDGVGKRVFLANAKAMKLYNIEDVIKVECDFSNAPFWSIIRLTVRDLEDSFFEIKAMLMTSRKLRPIDSLLSVMLESRATHANSIPPQSN